MKQASRFPTWLGTVLTLALSACGTDHPFSRGEADKLRRESSQGGALPPVDAAYFAAKVAPALQTSCNSCHANPAASYKAALALVKPGESGQSPLYLRATGNGHREVWPAGTEQARALKDWIDGISGEQPGPEPTPTPSQTPALNRAFFESHLQKRFQVSCSGCHGNPAPDFTTATSKVKPLDVEGSPLYLMAIGRGHREVWPEGGDSARILRKWIEGKSGEDEPTPSPPILSRVFFERNVKTTFYEGCTLCHANPAPDFDIAYAKVVPKKPGKSSLYRKATGYDGHVKMWDPGADNAIMLWRWIKGEGT